MHLKISCKLLLVGSAIAAVSAAQPAAAQRGYGGVIFIEPDVAEEGEEATKEKKPELTEEEKRRLAEERRRQAEENRKRWEEWRERQRIAAQDDIYPFQDKMLQALTSNHLEKFAGDRQLARWLKRLEEVRDETQEDWISFADPPALPGGKPILIAAATMQETGEDACVNPEDCVEEDSSIVLTGARKVTAPNVTNVQSAGVDEGDIVKQIGNYLLTLQDGRIFVVDIRNMRLTDRADVYRKDEDGDTIGADWYDEMLVQDDHILITAYSYDDEATELSIFSLDQATGKISADGVFLISSDDYYDVSNYASRIIGDKLVLYAPYSVDPDDIELDGESWNKPYIRRWLGAEERDEEQQKGKALFGGRDIYKPLLATNDPTIHTISVCPLGGYNSGKNLRCRTTGFLGPEAAQMYVNAKHIYLWNSLAYEIDGNHWAQNECSAEQLGIYPGNKQAAQSALYKLTVRGDDVGVVGVRGGVFDQYSMDEYRGRFRALSPRQDIKCATNYDDDDGWTQHVALLDIPLNRFQAIFREARGSDYAPLPAPNGNGLVQNRFSGNWLTYGSKGDYWRVPDDEEEIASAARNFAVAVPVSTPQEAAKIPLGHGVSRLELVGNDVVINGYRDDKGLVVSFLKMDGRPKISDQIFLGSRYETENRSHAFNSITNDNGGSIMGVPTSFREADAGRRWWWSNRSDLSFITVSPDGKLADAGALIGKKEDESEVSDGYVCEVSCIDWYGNARPIFTDNRIFGLMDTSLIEAEISGGRIAEKIHIDMTAPVKPRTAGSGSDNATGE